MTAKQVIRTEDLSLEDWLRLVFQPPKKALFCYWSFPTDKHRAEYLATIHQRSDSEVRQLLLNFLIPTGSLGTDETSLYWLMGQSADKEKKLLEFQYYRRLWLYSINPRKNPPPWEGITWILDLLPYFPKDALEGLRAYSFAHIQFLPDGRINGLSDVEAIIRAKYIGLPGTRAEKVAVLKDLSPRDFEHIVERLYHKMDYKTQLTKPTKDGGRDILAEKEEIAQREKTLVECKRYERPIDVKTVRALMGVVTSEKVNKGVLVTTSRFTHSAKGFAAENPRLELISGDELVGLMNEHLGATWYLHLDSLINDSQRESAP